MATVNVNVAEVKEIAELEKVGPVLAERIVDYREQNDKFSSVDELSEVTGIGGKLLEQIKARNEILVDQGDELELGTKMKVGERENLDLCPALQSCPFYEDKYCKNNYEECARYKIFGSALDSNEHLPASLLPTDHEQAEQLLNEKLEK